MRERPSPIAVAMTALFFLVLIVIGSLVWRYQGDEISMVIAPSITPIPPTVTYTPTWTPLPTNTRPPTNTPTTSPTPAPTNTPRPARAHTVASGETLIGISLLYRVSPESIAQANNIAPDAAVQVNQSLLIPWPTPTPPLTMIAVEVNGETVIADPTDCERYQVQSGDSIVAIANRFGVQFDLLAQVNRIDDPSLLQPGDTVCIPQIIYGESLPPTPGPSPTPTETSPPPGPQLLYPLNEATIDPPDGVVTFQWAAVKDLTETEWYMVELSNADDLDGQAWRGFTRDNSFQAPSHWRPDAPETRRMRWRVSIVNVTGERSDGLPIYTYGGESSQDAYFYWLGAVPTATPTQTVTPTVVPES